MKSFILAAALASSALVCLPSVSSAYANANAGSKLYVCATPQQNDLDRAGYEALTWVEVKAIGNHGETGSNTNILSYDTWDTTVIQKAKGMTDAGSPEIEVARIPTDPGQTILRNGAATNLNYAFKMVRNDAAVVGGTGTVRYNRGLIAGPKSPNGRNEDFDLEVFTLALQQLEITVDPTAGGVAPTLTVEPVITGTAQVGVELTTTTGTFTGDAVINYAYQWFAGGVAIVGATLNAFTPTTAELGKIVSVRVVATNSSGTASGFSAPTAAVIAA